MTRALLIIIAVVMVLLVGAGFLANHYHESAITYKEQRDKSKGELQAANHAIMDMQTRQHDVAALDAKYTKELADAKASIDKLQSDVVAGRKRLQLSGTCPKQSSSSTSSVGDDAAAGLTADAERDYWRLRSGISALTNQVIYLQDYINHMCLK